MPRKRDKWLGFKIGMVSVLISFVGGGLVFFGDESLARIGRMLWAGSVFGIILGGVLHFVAVFESISDAKSGHQKE